MCKWDQRDNSVGREVLHPKGRGHPRVDSVGKG